MRLLTKELADKINRVQMHSPVKTPVVCPYRSGEPAPNEIMKLVEQGESYQKIKEKSNTEHLENGRDRAIMLAGQSGYFECPFCGHKEKIENHEVFLNTVKSQLELKITEKILEESNPFQVYESVVPYEEALEVYREVQRKNAESLGIGLEAYLAEHNPVQHRQRYAPEKAFVQRSALMTRIMSGKKPLDFPPPKNGNFPWYELIDSSEPIGVNLGVIGAPYEVQKKFFELPKENKLCVNQNAWEIEWLNEDGEKFIDWLSRWSKEVLSGDLSNRLVNEGLSIAENLVPEIILKDPSYGNFRVFYGKSFGNNDLYRKELYQTNMDILKASKFKDLNGLNLEVVEVVKEHPQNKIDHPFWDVFKKQFGAQNHEIKQQMFEILTLDEPAKDFDLVSVVSRQWLIEKVK